MNNRVQQFIKVQKEGLEGLVLFKRKNKDYGDALANYGSIGVIVRMGGIKFKDYLVFQKIV